MSKRFGKTQALENINLEIPEGVVFALLGENGAGKSTMIRILTGFLNPDAGESSVLGRSSKSDALAIRRQIGYVSDSPALYDWMTVGEIGWFTSGFYDDSFLERFKKSVTEFDLPTQTKIKNLSKGQRGKVSLALATAHDPKLLILDEPTSGLDPMVRRQFLESMVDRTATGRSVLLSSHHINEVERVADWIGILHEGKLKLVKPLQEIRDTMWIVTLTLSDASLSHPKPPGTILSKSQHGRQIRWVIQNSPLDGLREFKSIKGVSDVDVTPATLEEVFIAICDQRTSKPEPITEKIGSSKKRTLAVSLES
ncbi:MAG: ABC transporter ATP-binding protein [Verrucomicrobia bacterium]|nr:ABC transporter ATP-binding protein [Verrucomicrobiota bacterium]